MRLALSRGTDDANFITTLMEPIDLVRRLTPDVFNHATVCEDRDDENTEVSETSERVEPSRLHEQSHGGVDGSIIDFSFLSKYSIIDSNANGGTNLENAQHSRPNAFEHNP
jgi:hypothetical protein